MRILLIILFFFIGCSSNQNVVDFNTPLFINVKINKHSYNFLLDTGSTYSTIDEKIVSVEKLTYHDSYTTIITYSGEQVIAPKLEKINVLIYGKEVSCNLIVTNLTQLNSSSKLKIDGIIGLDILKANNFVINFKEKTITIN